METIEAVVQTLRPYTWGWQATVPGVSFLGRPVGLRVDTQPEPTGGPSPPPDETEVGLVRLVLGALPTILPEIERHCRDHADSPDILGLGPIRWKFVRDDRVFEQPVPPARAILERSLGDVLPDSYVPYREIEWVEVPADRSAGVVDALAAAGRFPVREHPDGVRVVGYTW